MSNSIRTRDRNPTDFVDGVKVKGIDISDTQYVGIRDDLASGDTGKGSTLITHRLNYVGAAMLDIGTLFNMMPVRPEQMVDYEIISGVTDATSAIQAAMLYSPVVELADKTYIVSGTCVSDLTGGTVRGTGQERTTIHAMHTSGSVFRFQRQYSKLQNLSITGSPERTASGFNGACFGAHFEAADILDDPNITRMRNCHISDVTISGQTRAALYLVGPTLDGTKIERCRILNNYGHAIAVDRGFLSERYYLATNSVGVLTIDNSLAYGNSGHALALGHKDDTITTQTVRCVVNNYDANGSDMVQELLYHNTRKHVFWISGSNNEINTCVTTGGWVGTSPSPGIPVTGVFIQGTGNWIRNLRQIKTTASVEIGDNVLNLYTDGIFIDGITVINTTSQQYAVVAANAPNAKNIRVNVRYNSDITEKIDVWSNVGTVVEDSNQILMTETNTIVNNTTSQVDVNNLRAFLAAGRKIRIRAILYYSGDPTADIRVSIGGPAGATLVRYGPSGNLKLGAGDAVDTANSVSSFGSVISFGASASIRVVVIEGVIHNGLTSGNVSVRFAQLTAVGANTTVHTGSTFEITSIN